MTEKDKKNSHSKVCGVAYDKKDITRIVKFAKKHRLNYYYIKHKKESDDLKVHYHFIIQGDSRHRFNITCLLSETFKINLIQVCSSVDSYLRYMIHLDYVDKIHYNCDDIISNVSRSDIQSMVNNGISLSKTEINKANFNIILQAIVSGLLSNLKEIYEFCQSNDIDYLSSWTFTFVQFLKNN